jgi:hypothetical protein
MLATTILKHLAIEVVFVCSILNQTIMIDASITTSGSDVWL